MNQDLKESIKKKYTQIAISGNVDCCCMPGECKSDKSPITATKIIGYHQKDIRSIPQESILGVGCGAPINYANLKKGEVVVDLGSGAGIDTFLASKKVSNSGKAIGIDMTDKMLEKARNNAQKWNYSNVEFRKGDIEENIPVDTNTVDVIISNCVINLTKNKINSFKEIFRILKNDGRMIISDLITDLELPPEQINSNQWCECIDGALTKENYILCMNHAGFKKIEVLQEQVYKEDKINGRKITSLTIKALK
jgi:arsenite methyltransferase